MKFACGIGLLVLLGAGCAHTHPAPVKSPGGMNAEEHAACESFDCRYFLAPCTLAEHSPAYSEASKIAKNTVYISLKEEEYLRDVDNLVQVGYCAVPPRKMPPELYNHDTCIFVFVKRPDCKAVLKDLPRPAS